MGLPFVGHCLSSFTFLAHTHTAPQVLLLSDELHLDELLALECMAAARYEVRLRSSHTLTKGLAVPRRGGLAFPAHACVPSEN